MEEGVKGSAWDTGKDQWVTTSQGNGRVREDQGSCHQSYLSKMKTRAMLCIISSLSYAYIF